LENFLSALYQLRKLFRDYHQFLQYFNLSCSVNASKFNRISGNCSSFVSDVYGPEENESIPHQKPEPALKKNVLHTSRNQISIKLKIREGKYIAQIVRHLIIINTEK
jgi:hypothetical protein